MICLVVSVLLLLPVTTRSISAEAFSLPWMIGWGATSDAPGWNESLNIEATREGCDSQPPKCITYLNTKVGSGNIQRVILSFPLNTKAPVSSLEYSRYSLTNQWLYSIGIDDFIEKYKALVVNTSKADALSILTQTITNAHFANPALKFGITLYETEIDSHFFAGDLFPAALRAQVDIVHFYRGYRANADSLSGDIDRIKGWFPHAQIVGGIYPYDRDDYVSCEPRGTSHCGSPRALALFERELGKDVELLKSGRMSRLEFYPGYLGAPGRWPGWQEKRICAPARREACVQNSQVMQEKLRITLERLSK